MQTASIVPSLSKLLVLTLCAQNSKQDFETNFALPLKTRHDGYAGASYVCEVYLKNKQYAKTATFLDQKSQWSLWTTLTYF